MLSFKHKLELFQTWFQPPEAVLTNSLCFAALKILGAEWAPTVVRCNTYNCTSIYYCDGSIKVHNFNLYAEKVEDDSFGQESVKELAEQHDQASALLHACRRHLQLQSSAASPSHLAAMLNEAAITYEKLGDRKALQDCRNIMMQFTNTCS